MRIVWVNRSQFARHKTCRVYRIFVELPMYVRPYRAYSVLPFNTVRKPSKLLPNFITISKINNCNISWCNCKQKIVNVAKLYYNTTGSVLYLCRNAETRSYNYCCSRKAIGITYCECVCVCKRCSQVCNVQMPYCHHIFPHYLKNGTI